LDSEILVTATDFVNDLAKRVRGRVQITTDALKTYVNVIEDAFGSEVDFAELHKVYRAPMENETRYSPKTSQNQAKVVPSVTALGHHPRCSKNPQR
jgi:hypothetical protein